MAKKGTGDALQALKASLRAGEPERLYIFFGEEIFLLQHYLEQLRKTVLEEMTADFNYHRLTAESFDIRSFADAVENLPMMAPRTLIQVDEVDPFKLPEDARDLLVQLLVDIPAYCTVVFTFETTPWKPDKRCKKLWEVIEKKGALVEFARQSQRDLITWVTRHFGARHKQISPELCAYLIDMTDGTMTSIGGEIAKIAAYSGSDVICRADIDAVTEPVLDAVVFRMTDQLAAGDYEQALLTLQKLLKMQQEPIAILGAVGSHFRRLSTARTLLDHGKSSGELMQLCGLPDYPARKTMEAARRFTPRFCAAAAEQILETDFRMKTSYDDPARLLELLVLNLAEEASHA